MDKTDREILKGCAQGERSAQARLYQQSKAKLFGICLRYASDRVEAEDYLQEAYVLIFKDLYQFQPSGSLISWLRKVTVNSCLMQIRKRKNIFLSTDFSSQSIDRVSEVAADDLLSAKELLGIVQKLPAGFRTVFNLKAIDGYKHEEIAEQLNISVNTSKSQYNRAKTALKKLIEQHYTI